MAANVRRVVKSRSNRRLLTAAESFISTYPEVRAILPGGAATRLASAEIVYRGRGTAGVHRTTLIQFAASLARPAMAKRALVPLSPLGQEAVAARIVHAARQNREIEYFNPVAALPGFSRALARTLGELRLAGVAPEDLESTGASGPDLSRLLSRYRAELEARSLADLSAIFQLAGEAAETSAEAALPLLLLDAPLDTRAHRDFFSRLVARAPAVLAAISSGEHTESILGVEAEDLDAGKSATPIEHLRQYVFSEAPPASATQDGFEMFSAPGEGLEAVEIARRILRMTAEGIRFDQIAILLRNPERYQPVIEEALRRARIPAYFSRGTARPDPAGRAFLALLACASERCSASRFAEYLSIGQVPSLGHGSFEPWVPPADELLMPPEERAQPSDRQPEKTIRTPANWEKLLVDAAVIGGRDRWERRLKGLEREFELRRESLEDDEPQREYLTRQLERLRNLSDFALPLVAVLDALPRSASWGEWLVALANLARMAISNPEGVLAVLAEFEPMAEVGPVALEEAAEVLSERLRFLRTEPPQRRWGRVYVGSVDEARGCEFRVVFLPGLAEGLFPQRVLEDPLLLDQCREQLPGSLPVRADRNKEERQRLNMAIAAARERFIASYPRMDVAQARPRVPSFYALELPRALEGALPKLKDFEARARTAAPARLNWPAPRETSQAIDDAEYDLAVLGSASRTHTAAARYLVEANESLARSLRGRYARWRPGWKEADGLVTRKEPALAALAEHRLGARVWSPSSLEQFAACPYKFALHGIYRLRPREEAVPLEYLDPLTRGALFHAIQYGLQTELKLRGLAPLNQSRLAEALAAADETIEKVAAQYAEDLAPAIPRVWKSEIEDLRTDVRGWLQQVAQNDDEWEPLYFEFAFGLERLEGRDPASVPEPAVLAEGASIRGSIDLVEKNLRTGSLRVTDHKTGKVPERIPAVTGGGRVLQPLLYALAAEKMLRQTVETGRLFYATQRGGYQQVVIEVNDRSRRFLSKLLQNVDAAIGAGFLPPFPEKDTCKNCDYRPVCGPYEEQRSLRHKDRRDERLDPLNEIRGFL